jgi:hypothetical protein
MSAAADKELLAAAAEPRWGGTGDGANRGGQTLDASFEIKTLTVPEGLDGAGVRTSDLSRVRALVREHGYCIVEGHDCREEHDAAHAAASIWGGDLLAAPGACEVRDGAVGDDGLASEEPGVRIVAPHSDGFAYGDALPDYFMLSCAVHSEGGGENFLVDGLKVLEAIDADPETRWAAEALRSRPIDQTEAAKRPSISTVVQQTPGGRLMFRHLPFLQTAWGGSDDFESDTKMLRIFHGFTARQAASPDALWLKLKAGEAVVIDNYRMFHGRAPYALAAGAPDRMLWRQWIWSSESKTGLPSGPLYSDSRFADEAFLELEQADLDKLAEMPLEELKLVHEENRQASELGHRNLIPGSKGAVHGATGGQQISPQTSSQFTVKQSSKL